MKKNTINNVTIALMAVMLLIFVFNSYELNAIKPQSIDTASGRSQAQLNGPDVIPKGVPEVYGKEIGISFDDVSPSDPARANAAIAKLKQLDASLKLDDAQKTRYINVLYNLNDGISCEYCCGARSVIFATGEPACGCAHSYAMRGLAKYLIINHGSEYSDSQIQEEVAKWKVLFFPGILAQKASVLQDNGIELNYANLASNRYKGIEKGSATGGAMVGGC